MPRSILAFAFGLGLATAAQAGVPDRPAPPPATDNAVLRWNAALLEAVRAVRLAPPMTARALAIAHTCMFDAWAAYDHRADGTRFGGTLRRPKPERTLANKTSAVSYAAHRALSDLFPTQVARFDATLRDLGLDPLDGSTGVASPAGIGHTACEAVLAVRHADGANQLGDLNGGPPYSDYTGYAPVNNPEHLHDPARWQPLRGADGTAQTFLAPHWRHVVPFALATADEFRPQPPAMPGSAEYLRQADEIRAFSAQLTDRRKAIAEYWADGPATETPPGHWALLASWVSRRDRHGLDDDVVLFFALGNAHARRQHRGLGRQGLLRLRPPGERGPLRLRRPDDRGVGRSRSRGRASSPASSSVHISPRRPSPSTPRATARSARPRRPCCACSPAARASARRWSSRPAASAIEPA